MNPPIEQEEIQEKTQKPKIHSSASSRPVTTDKNNEDEEQHRNQFYQRMSRDLSSTKTSLYKTTPPSRELISSSRRSIKSPASDFASLSDYWLAQDQSRKTRVKSLYSADELAQSNGTSNNLQSSFGAPAHHPSEDASLYSPRQQSLLSTAEGLRKSSTDYGSMYGGSPNYR